MPCVLRVVARHLSRASSDCGDSPITILPLQFSVIVVKTTLL